MKFTIQGSDCHLRYISQICSAVHNQEYTIVQDYISGLKTLLYLKSLELDGWDGQSVPTPVHQLGKPVVRMKDTLGKVSGAISLSPAGVLSLVMKHLAVGVRECFSNSRTR